MSGLWLTWLAIANPAVAGPRDEPVVEPYRCLATKARTEWQSNKRRKTMLPPPLGDVTTLQMRDLVQMRDDLLPLVEQVAGGRFSEVPGVGMGTDAELGELLYEETLEMLRKLFDAPEELIESMARRAQGSAGILLGKYGLSTKKVYLGLPTLQRSADAKDLGPDERLDAACLVLGHELAHALQMQLASHDERFARLGGIEGFECLHAVGEGHAVFVERGVAQAFDRMPLFWTLTEGQGWGPEGLMEPRAFSIWAAYGQGLRFIDYHYQAGGHDQVWRVLRELPVQTRMIFRPETYRASVQAPRDYGDLLLGVEQKLTKGEWMRANGPIGELSLREATVGLDEQRIRDTLDSLVWGHELALQRGDRSASVQVLEFADADAPHQFLELLADGQQAAAEAMSSPMQRWVVQVRPYDGVQGDAVVRRVLQPAEPHPSSEETDSVWVARGTRLVAVRAVGFRPGLRMDWTLEEVFRRLDRSESASP
jgi:hypothetical protein